MTLQELLAFCGGMSGAAAWSMALGHRFGVWAGVAAFIGGGFVGLLLGWCFGEWLNRPPHTSARRDAVGAVAGLVVSLMGFAALVALPLWLYKQLH